MINEIFSLFNKYKYNIIVTLLSIVFFIGMCCAITQCSNAKNENEQNIIALTDSINYYKTTKGDLVASKTLLNGDLSTLKLANDSLYNIIKSMKITNPSSIVAVKSTIDNGKHDTAWIVSHDTIGAQVNIRKNFAFNNKYRMLAGNVFYNDSLLGLKVDTDIVNLDYTMVIKDNTVYLQTDNPYIKYNKIEGLTLPTTTKKKWSLGIGPSIGYGYDFVAKKFNPYIGISVNLNYNLLQW